MPKSRLLLVGWDAADWKVIQPLLQAGQMPNLARLISAGVHGNLATIYPVLSPMLWTSIATGKRAYKHGIHGFSEPFPDGSGVRPISLLSRKTKAVWNILNQTGHRSIVAGWWPSHPAEPINGAMVSNHFQQPAGTPGGMPPLPVGTVHPESLATQLAELRVNPMELDGDFLRLFVPEYEKVDQSKDKRLHSLAKIVAETMSVHAAATELLANETWDFAAIYYAAIDHFEHGFMRYHPPRLPWVTEEDSAIYQDVVANAYRYHDAMLGTLLSFCDENTSILVMSDHGFHPDHLRPGYIPAEPAGPAVEHRHFGIFCLKGPAVRAQEQVYGASLLDICPTILTLFGLPPGKDMDGKVLSTVFKEPPTLAPIESWDQIAGDAGTHSEGTRLDPVASAQAFKQLVELGYVAPPGPNVQETVDECTRELRYNLARAYRDGNCCGEAAALAEALWVRWPKEHRFGILLIDCLGPLHQVARRRTAIEELGRSIERYQAEARIELERREQARSSRKEANGEAPDPVKGPGRQTREQFEERQLRELANGRPLLLEWLLASQTLLEKRPAEARGYLAKLGQVESLSHGMSQRVAAALMELGEVESAQELLNSALEFDPENPLVHGQLATIHFKAGRFDQAIVSATESLSLMYFQPALHALLGQALMKTNRFPEAEQELRVAVAQSPRNLAAHETLGQLYRNHLHRPQDAFAHEGRARSLHHELARQQQSDLRHQKVASVEMPTTNQLRDINEAQYTSNESALPAPFCPEVGPGRIITVVAGLPRSGTSMMMQILAAAGRSILTDSKRVADEDNPLGYLEFEKTLELAKDSSWLADARGKVVKIVAQLLPFLPATEHYQVILMERNLSEVIASQQAMLSRQGRTGAALDAEDLRKTYATHLSHVRAQLKSRGEIRLFSVNYSELLANPDHGIARLAEFLDRPFDVQAATASIRPELRRQKVTRE